MMMMMNWGANVNRISQKTAVNRTVKITADQHRVLLRKGTGSLVTLHETCSRSALLTTGTG